MSAMHTTAVPTDPLVLLTATTIVVDRQSVVAVPEAYVTAIAAAGLVPIVLPPLDAPRAIAALANVAGLVLTGGGEDIDARCFGEEPHPAAGIPNCARDAYEIALATAAHARRLPTLALCRGAQIMTIALGGTLIQDIPTQVPESNHPKSDHRAHRVHLVELEPASRLADVLGARRIAVNSFHHQAIGRTPAAIRVVGRSPDGIVEAIESTEPAWWMMGVQWHPELLTETAEDWDRRLFAAFAHEVRRRSSTR